MGIVTLTIEALALSSALAAVRRVGGYSVKDYVLSRVSHESYPFLNTVASGYFNAGEYIVTSVVTSAVNLYSSTGDKETTTATKDSKKKD